MYSDAGPRTVSDGTGSPSLLPSPGAPVAARHCSDQRFLLMSSSDIPEASDQSAGATRPRKSEQAKEETRETRSVLAKASERSRLILEIFE